jgi:hypothetical protein
MLSQVYLTIITLKSECARQVGGGMGIVLCGSITLYPPPHTHTHTQTHTHAHTHAHTVDPFIKTTK